MNSKLLINHLEKIIKNPNIYVAAVIGVLIGLCMGALVGSFSGGFIGYTLKLCSHCVAYPFGIDPSIVWGVGIGVVFGASAGGFIIGIITMGKIYNKTQEAPVLSHENVPKILWSTIMVGVEVAIGMGLGAIIGSLKNPGYGSIVGSLIGVTLMLFTSTLEKKQKK